MHDSVGYGGGRVFLAAFLLACPFVSAVADVSKAVAEAEALRGQGASAEAARLLLDTIPSANSGAEQAELYWRAARETLDLGDSAEMAGKPRAAVLAVFVEGRGYAEKAITSDPLNDLGYYWKAANIGRWSQVKGGLDALSMSGPMRDLLVKELSLNPDRTDAYYLLGELYRELPGSPLSFGDVDAAVSLGRKAVEARRTQVETGGETELRYNFYTELARSLRRRGWSKATRAAEQKHKAAKLATAVTPLEKASLYEATISVQDVSDHDEARALVQWVVSSLEGASLTPLQKKDLQKAKELLRSW